MGRKRHKCEYGEPDQWQDSKSGWNAEYEPPVYESRARWCKSSNCNGLVEECRPNEIGAALWVAALALWNEESKRPPTRLRDTREVVEEALAQDFCCEWTRSLLEGE